MEAFEQELFVRVVVTPWARAKDRQRGGGEEAGEAKSESGMKRRRLGRKSKSPTPSGMPSGTEDDEETEDEEGEDEEEEVTGGGAKKGEDEEGEDDE